MSHIQIVLPFSLPPPELANDLLRELSLPSLSLLLARSATKKSSQPDRFDTNDSETELMRALPHEGWLCSRLKTESQVDTSPAVAAGLMHNLKLPFEDGYWLIMQPVHFHIARDHLVLTDVRGLQISESESRTLFEIAVPLCDAAGMQLHYGSKDFWFLRGNGYSDLKTSTPDAACGHNIDIWMPKGSSAREWRKLQNEIQMEWHTHPINQARSDNGMLAVNSLWLWGGAQSSSDKAAEISNYPALFRFTGWFAGFADSNPAAIEPQPQATMNEVVDHPAACRLLLLDDLIAPALACNWSDWLDQFHKIELDWITPAMDALKKGKIDRLSLLLSDGTHLKEYSASRLSLHKIWLKPALRGLLP
jgi:hypothetical protein